MYMYDMTSRFFARDDRLYRVYRGGCWYDSRAQAGVEYRDFSASHGGQPDFGVRLVYTELQVDT